VDVVRIVGKRNKSIQSSEENALSSILSGEKKQYSQVERSIVREYSRLIEQESFTPDQIATLVDSQSKSLSVKSSTVRSLKSLYSKQSNEGFVLSRELMDRRSPQEKYKSPKSDFVQEAIDDTKSRLGDRQRDFSNRNKAILTEAARRGWGSDKLRRSLRRNYQSYESNVKRILQTESIKSVNQSLLNQYKANGVEYVQRISQEDDRVCAFCAERAGKVYPIDKAPTVIHPNDRCYNMPWSVASYMEGMTEDEVMEEHLSDVSARASGRSIELTPFEKQAGILESDISSPIDLYLEGIDSIPIEERINYDRQLVERLRDYRIPGEMGEAPFYRQVWSFVQGALLTGLTLGAYAVVRQRYRARIPLSALEASTLASSKDFNYLTASYLHQSRGEKTVLNETEEELARRERDYQKAQNIESAERVVFIAGGLAGLGGFSSLEARDQIAANMGENITFIDTPNPDFEISIGLAELQQNLSGLGPLAGTIAGIMTAKNMAQMMATNALVNGKNQTSIRMAAQALNFHKQYPDKPITLMGFSGGGIAAKEAAIILNQLGLRVNVISSGSPDFGIFRESDFYPGQHTGFKGKGDIVPLAGGPPMNNIELADVPSHSYLDYATSPTYQRMLADAMANGRPTLEHENNKESFNRYWSEWAEVNKQTPNFDIDTSLESSLSSSIDAARDAVTGIYGGISEFIKGVTDPSKIDDALNSTLDPDKSAKRSLSVASTAITSTLLTERIDPLQYKSTEKSYRMSVDNLISDVYSDFKNGEVRSPKSYREEISNGISLTDYQEQKIEKYISNLISRLKHAYATPLSAYPSEIALSSSF